MQSVPSICAGLAATSLLMLQLPLAAKRQAQLALLNAIPTLCQHGQHLGAPPKTLLLYQDHLQSSGMLEGLAERLSS